MILQIIFAGVVATAFCILFQGHGWNIAIAALNGALGYLIYLSLYGSGSLMALVLASGFMAIFAEVAARVRKVPAIMFLAGALIPIVPGGGIYECALMVLQGRRFEAMKQFGNVVMEAGAIAIGIILVSSLNRFINKKTYLKKRIGNMEDVENIEDMEENDLI